MARRAEFTKGAGRLFLHGSDQVMAEGTVLQPHLHATEDYSEGGEFAHQAGHIFMSSSVRPILNNWPAKHIYEVEAHGDVEPDPSGGLHDWRTQGHVIVRRRIGGGGLRDKPVWEHEGD